MMAEFATAHRKMRVWVNELPDVRCANGDVRWRSLKVEHPSGGSDASAAVEIFLPTGTRALYGLLGGTLKPGGDRELTIEVVTCGAPSAGPAWSLASRVDEVRVGLPPTDYVRYTFDGVVRGVEAAGVGGGVLQMDRALLGAFGSGPIVFRWLAETIVRLQAAAARIESPADVQAVVDLRSDIAGRWSDDR